MPKLTPVQIKDLSLENLRDILELRASDISIFIGQRGKVLLTSELESAFLNGAMVQVNLETAALADVLDDDAFQYAFGAPESEAA